MKQFIAAIFCVTVAVAPLLAQARQDSIANLIQAGNRKAALEKIRTGADVNELQPDGTSAVHWAVYKVDYELLDALIAKKAKVGVINEFGSTPIAEAVKLADARMVKALLAAGAEPEAPNRDGQTSLMLAIKAGELPIVEMLINARANVNVVEKFENQTPLMWAAAATRNAGEMVKLLLSKGANVKARAEFTDWPSQITSEPRAQYRPVGGLTALLYAARSGCYTCVEALIGAGADVNVPTPEAVTPLMIAIDNDHNEVAKLLLDRGANPHVSDWWGRTALYITIDRKVAAGGGGGRGGGRGGRGGAAVAALAGAPAPVTSMELVTALLAKDVNPNPQLNMHRPSRGGNSGRFVENQLSTGCTPLFRAVQGSDAEVVRALLAKGANPNINTMGLTAFLVAAGVGPGSRGGTGLAAQGAVGGPVNIALMDELVKSGADVNAQLTGTKTYTMRVSRAPSSNEGMTALHVAVQSSRVDMVRYLLDKGANTQLLDASGRKPIDLLAPAGRGGDVTPLPAAGAAPAPGAGGRAAAVTPATLAEIRTLLESAAKK